MVVSVEEIVQAVRQVVNEIEVPVESESVYSPEDLIRIAHEAAALATRSGQLCKKAVHNYERNIAALDYI